MNTHIVHRIRMQETVSQTYLKAGLPHRKYDTNMPALIREHTHRDQETERQEGRRGERGKWRRWRRKRGGERGRGQEGREGEKDALQRRPHGNLSAEVNSDM